MFYFNTHLCIGYLIIWRLGLLKEENAMPELQGFLACFIVVVDSSRQAVQGTRRCFNSSQTIYLNVLTRVC